MLSTPQSKTSKAISKQLITPFKRLSFLLLITFSLYSYNASAKEVKPIAFSDDINISQGAAGTIVKLTNPTTPFNNSTNTDNVQLAGGDPISGVTFDASDNSLVVTIPCGASSGNFSVDGVVVPNSSFTYITPNITTALPDISLCVGQTFNVIPLEGTLPQSSGLMFNWTNTNTNIGLTDIQNNVSEIPTFTSQNVTSEPISSTITVTPVVNGCEGDAVTFTITINPVPVLNTINNNTYCHGETVPSIILSASSPTIGTGVSYTWSRTGDNIGFSPTNGSDSPISSFTAINTGTTALTTTFTVIPTFAGCNGVPEEFTITVNPQSTGGTVTATQTNICENDSTILTLNDSIGSILRWESSNDNFATSTPISNTSDNLNASPTVNTKYRAVVQNGSCSEVNSDEIEIIVDATVVSGTVIGGSTICENETSGLLTLTNTNGTVVTWQSSTDAGASWINIPGTIGITSYTSGALDQATSFRAMVTNGSCTAQPSAATNVIIREQLNRGNLNITSGAATVCENTSVDLELTGEIGTIIRWESKESSSTTWNSISNITSTHTTDLLGVSTEFRVFIQNGNCGSGYSPVQEIIVEKTPNYSALSISSGSTSPICSGATTDLELTITEGILVRWETRPTGGGVWSNYTGMIVSGPNTYTTAVIDNPIEFKAILTSDGTGICGEKETNFITINVEESAVGGALSTTGAAAVCPDTSIDITLTGETGTVSQWEYASSTAPNNWSIVTPNNTTTILNTGNLSENTRYRALVKSGVCEAYSSEIEITLNALPNITDIPNQEACFGDFFTFGDPASVPGYSYLWSTGATTSSLSLTITSSGSYSLVTTEDATGCSIEDSFEITMQPLPDATVIADASICEGNQIAIGAADITTSTYSWVATPSYTWTVSDPATSANPNVAPLVTTTFTLTETVAATGCQQTNSVTITVEPDPTVSLNRGTSISMCEAETSSNIDATITGGYLNTLWEVIPAASGTVNILSPTEIDFSPSAQAITNGTAIVRLTVTNTCGDDLPFVDTTITIDRQSIADAGTDGTVCDRNPITLDGSGSQFVNTFQWSKPTGITGNLTAANTANPVYTPSADDVLNASTLFPSGIPFTLTTSSGTNCPSDTSIAIVNIIPSPIISSGPSTTTICENTTYSPTATIDANTADFVWSSSGDGEFTNRNSINPTYTPGVTDKATGTVTLTLTANGNTPCTEVTSETVLTIEKNPTIETIIDSDVCASPTNPLNLTATIGNPGVIFWETTNGGGSFNGTENSATPIYTPVNADLNTDITFKVSVAPINPCGISTTETFIYTINAEPIINAGGDLTICESQPTISLNGTQANAASTRWTSNGSGSFDSDTNIDPTYTFSQTDINNGSVTFTLTGSQTSCNPVSDNVTITIQQKPTVTAGLAQTICQGESVTLNGTGTNTSGVEWSRSSGTGNFTNTTTLNPTYTSSPNEEGTITFTIVGQPEGPCGTQTQGISTTVTIIPEPSAEAGDNATICEGESFTITTASATNISGTVNWSGGGGTFTGQNTLSPTYTPSTNDINQGFATLKLTAAKDSPCFSDAEDEMTITINKIPSIIVVNPTIDVCSGLAPFEIEGVTASNFDTLAWVSSSSGTNGFSDPNPLNTDTGIFYTPSQGDIDLGSVILTLEASRNPLNCNSSTTNSITLNFIEAPTADAGPDTTICEGTSYTTLSATANNPQAIWNSTGSGIWNSQNTVSNAVYSPSPEDILLGSVELTLTITGLAPCFDLVTDTLTLNFEALPVITTLDAGMCNTSTSFPITGTSITNNYEPITIDNWTSSGSGTFSSSGDPLNPIYTPSQIDKEGTRVTLTLEVTPMDPCLPKQSENLILSIIKTPIANAGINLSECETPFTITTATADVGTYSRLEWTSASGGTFQGGVINSINPTYIPSATDIGAGTVDLTLTAFPLAPCTIPSESTITVSIEKEPVITVTNQNPVCEDALNTEILGTTVSNANSFVYTSTTGTIINNETTLNPTVTPSVLDINNGFMTLTLTADANGACVTPVTETITIAIERNPVVTAGAASTFCEGAIITTNDASFSFVGTGNLQWDNNGGDGIFTTPSNTLITDYEPGPTEISNGQVQLTLTGTATSPCSANSVASVTHTIVKKPTLVINPTVVSICEDEVYQVISGQVTITDFANVDNIKWSASSPGTIATTGNLDLVPTFTPSATDIANGFSILTAEVTPIGPCTDLLTETIRVNITKNPTIDLSENSAVFCEGENKQLTATFTDQDAGTIEWEIVSGTGSLSNANIATPEYIPAVDSDVVVFKVSVTGNTPCSNSISENFTINRIQSPEVTLTQNFATVCSTDNTINLDALVTNTTTNTTYQWTSSNGSSTFGNSTNKDTSYTFSQADKDNGEVTLTLTATSDVDCALTDSDSIVITIAPAPIVTITNPATEICKDAIYSATAIATDATSYLWEIVGTSDGTFIDASLLNTQYIPGPNDILNGVFTIQITATGDAICTPVTTSTTVNIIPKPTITFNTDSGETCSETPFSIQGVLVTNYSNLTWSSLSSDVGTFSNPSIENPTYTPSQTEKASSNPIILRVTVAPIAPCDVNTETIFKDFTLNLLPVPTADAGDDIAICEGEVVALSGASTNDVSQYWTSSSTGTTVFANNKVATYTPNTLDINNGTVTLTLHVVSNTNCDEITDSVIITIAKQPTADAGPTVTICEDASYTLLDGEATVTNETSYQWMLSGGGAITLGTQNTLKPEFIPNPGQTGNVTLTLTALADPACGGLSDAIATKTIRIIPKPSVSIPTSGIVCEGEDLVIAASDILTSDFNTLNWTSSNNLGTFITNGLTGETIYRPEANQIGDVTLTLTATAIDGACIDASANLVLTVNPSVIVEAGSGTSICENETYTINDAAITNGDGVWNWSISGPAVITAGTENTLTPEIVPNLGASGTVTLTLVGNGSTICPTSAEDTVTILINALPIVDAGASVTVCQGVAEVPLLGNVLNATSYNWSQTGGAGTIVPTTNPLEPKYIPAAADFINATGETIVTVFLEAFGNNTCTNIQDNMTITLQANPTVYAGVDMTACKGDVINLSTALASNFDTLEWSTNGNGTFNYTTAGGSINPTYTLGNSSNDNSSVILTMTATPKGVCNTNSSDTITISVNQEPTILATQNVFDFCGTTFTLPDVVTVSNSLSYRWENTTIVGNKSPVINPTSETPTISPTQDEINNGFILLTLTAQPNTPCTSVAIETITINLTPEVIVEAGNPKTVCATDNLISLDFFNANVSSSNFYWTTDGTGTITPVNGTNSLQPQYQRGTNETGAIEFTLHANNLAPCTGEKIDTVILNIDPLPTAEAGSNITICEGSDVNITDANVANASSIEWIASSDISGTPLSDGLFSNGNTIINPSYQPSLNDIQRGFVYLIIKSSNTNSCSTEVASDYMRLTIAEGAGVFAGSNAKICMDDSYELADAFANNASNGVTWSAAQNSNGTSLGTYISGSFSNLNSINPTYTPSAADINQGHVYLFIEGSGASTCSVTDSFMRLDITSKPSITTQQNISVCVDSPSITLSSTAENYDTITWSVFSGTGTLSNVNSLNPTFTHGVATTTTTPETTILKAILTPKDGCDTSETIIKEVTITITPIPTGFAGDDGAVCYVPTQPIPLFTINNTNVSNANTLTWTSDGPGVFSTGTPTTYQSFSNTCPEIVNLTLTASGNCGTAKVIGVVQLTINCEAPSLGTITSSIPAPQNICQETTVSYQVPTNVHATEYNWTVPSGAVITSSLPYGNAISVAYGENSTSGMVSVAASNDCGTGPSSTFNVTINPILRATTISGPTIICKNNVNATYTAAPISGATGYQWTWTDGITTRDLGITTTNTLDITTATSLNSGDLQVSGINGCGEGIASAPFGITVTSTSLSSTTPPSDICSGTGFTYFLTSASSNVSFTWQRTIQSGIVGSASGTGDIVNDLLENTTTSSQPVTYEITLTNSNGCISTESITFNVLPVAQFVNTPDSEVCSGETFNFDTTSNPTGTVSWSRAAVAGISETSSTGTGDINEVLTNTTNAVVSVIYEVVLPVTNGCANTIEFSVDVLPKPSDASSISGPVSVCTPSINNIYMVAPIANATLYEWELDGTIIGTTAVNQISINFSLSAPVALKVRGTNSCTEGVFSNPLTINKAATPTLSNNPINAEICSNELFSYTPTSVSATNFNWDRAFVPGIATPSNTGIGAINEILVNTTNTPKTVSYTFSLVTVEGCTNTETVDVTVNPTPYIINSPVTSICSGSNFTFTPSLNIPSSVSWRRIPIANITGGSATGNGGINDPLVNLTSVIIPVSYEITLVDNANNCTAIETIIVNVNPLPTATIETSTTTCFNSADSFINFIGENGVAPYTFTYTINGGTQTTISTNGTETSAKLPLFSDAVGNYTYRLISVEDSSDIACEHTFDPTDASKAINVEIFEKPTLEITQPNAICELETIDIRGNTYITDFDANLTYTYWRDSDTTLALLAPESTTKGTYYIKAENTNGCSVTKPIVVQEKPLPSTQIENGLNEVFVCEGSDVVLNATGAISYSWYRLDAAGNPVTLSTSDVYTHTPTTNEKIYLTGTSANSCSSTSEIDINLLPAIKARITGITAHEVCVQATEPTITFTAENGTAPYTFTYTIGGNIRTITTIGTSNSAVLPISTNVSGVFNIELTGVQDGGTANCESPLLELPINATVSVFDSEITPATPTTIFQTICEAQPVNTIKFDVSANAVSGYVEGLPNNVTAIFSNIDDTITISGTPTETGVFEYTVFSSVGTNCTSTYTGRITINSDSNIVAPLNKDQTICSCGVITPIEFELNEDTLGATVSGLPNGIDWNVTNNIVTISGNSCDTSGDYNYTVSPQGFCTNTPITGKITIANISPIQVTSGNQNEVLCINTTLTDVVYQAAVGETLKFVGVLPAGITFVENPALGSATLSGTPENGGIYNYTITSDSACSDTIDGSILVNQDPFFNLIAGNISQVTCINSPIQTIRYQIAKNITDVNFTPILPDGVSYAINNEQLIISGTPSLIQGNTTYTFNPVGSCNDTFSRQINLEFTEETTINLEAGSGLTTQSVCQNAPIEPIQFTLLPLGTKVNQSTLPDFVNVTEINAFTGLWEITGTPLSTGVFNFDIESVNSLNCSVSLPIQIENLYAAVSVVLDSGSDNQTLCNFITPIENIVYKITGNIPNINIISVEGLPDGVTFSRTTILNGLLLTISGQANETGEFNYEVVYDDCGVIQNGFIKTSSPISINSTVTQASCNSDASIDLNIYGGVPYVDSSGNPFYNISWEGPNGFRQNQLSIVNLAPGEYTVNVSDAFTCGLLQTKTFTIEPLIQLSVNLLSTSLANGCNQELGCANFEYVGGSEIYTAFLLESLNPQTQIWEVKNPLNNNYFNICGLDIGLYRVSVSDSKGCTTDPYMFSIENDNQFLIESIIVQNSICEGNDGSIIVEVISVDQNLTFTYNGSNVSSIPLGNNTYELQIIGSDVANGILEIIDTGGCSISRNIKMKTLNSDFEYTSFEFENSGYFDVNESIEFTNMSFVDGGVFDPSIYSKIKWDFDDSTPFKTFSYPDDMVMNSNGESIQTVFHTFKNDGIYNVTLTSFNEAGCSVSVNKTIVIGKGSSVAFPTVFSPNNDGINDFYNPTYRGLTEFSMFIYDQLGNLIFEFTSTDAIALENDDTWGWNGIEAMNTTPKSGHYRCYFSGKTIDNKVIEKNVRFLIVK